MAIKLVTHPFITATQSRADAYAQWSGTSLVYSYYGGTHQHVLVELARRLEERGFSRWQDNYPGKCYYHSNDGRGHGGGFSGFCAYYGDMPLLGSIRFYNHGVEIRLYRADTSGGSLRPGLLIFEACLLDKAIPIEWEYDEDAHFENILK